MIDDEIKREKEKSESFTPSGMTKLVAVEADEHRSKLQPRCPYVDLWVIIYHGKVGKSTKSGQHAMLNGYFEQRVNHDDEIRAFMFGCKV